MLLFVLFLSHTLLLLLHVFLHLRTGNQCDVIPLEKNAAQNLAATILSQNFHRIIYNNIHKLIKSSNLTLNSGPSLLVEPDIYRHLLLKKLENKVDGRHHRPLGACRHLGSGGFVRYGVYQLTLLLLYSTSYDALKTNAANFQK